MHFDPVLFWNTIFDKGLLAAIVPLFGDVLNRQFERYRSGIALETEAAKTRLSRIAALWEEMNLWESDAKRSFVEFCGVAIAELRAAGLAPQAAAAKMNNRRNSARRAPSRQSKGL